MIRASRARIGAAAVLLLTACTGSTSQAAVSCSLTEVPSTSVVKDILSGVTAFGPDVVAAGTRFSGAQGVAITATTAASAWTTTTIRGYPYTSEELEDVAVAGPERAWAVGAIGSDRPAIVRWNGATWSNIDVADPGPEEDGLSGVSVVSDHLAWAVGRHEVGLWFHTLVERWNGTAWSIVASPDQGSRSSMLNDVDANGAVDAWAVGWSLAGDRYATLAEHWDGARWSVVPTPALGEGDHVFSGVAALGPSDVWAVGWSADGEAIRPLAEHWDGGGWTIEAFPADLDGAGLEAVARTGRGVMVVGRQMVNGNPSALAIVREGSSWTRVAVGTTEPNHAALSALTTDAAGRIWSVGSQFDASGLTASLVVSGCGP